MDPTATSEPTGDVTVLIVDDQAPFRIAMRALVRHLPGFALVGEAETGEQSVDVFRELRPALVLMDMNLPGMNGVEATQRILEVAPETVVFLCSTYERADLPPAIATSGAATYVHKEAITATLLRDLWAAHRPATQP